MAKRLTKKNGMTPLSLLYDYEQQQKREKLEEMIRILDRLLILSDFLEMRLNDYFYGKEVQQNIRIHG